MATDLTSPKLEVPAFRTAFEAEDVAAWLTFSTEDAKWLEYRFDAPPRAPHRMCGHTQIGAFLTGIAAADIVLTVVDEVIEPERVAFAITAIIPGGWRVYEHVIPHLPMTRIAH